MFSAILGRGPSHCCFDCEAFWCAGAKTQIGSPMADLHVGDQREGWKSKRLVRGAQPSTGPSSEKKRKSQSKQCLPLWWESGSASIPLFIVPSSADTGKLKDCSYVFTEASLLSHPQSDLRLFHQHCLSLKTAFILGRRSERERERKKKLHLWAVKLPCHPKRSHYWDKSPHSIP